MEEKVYSLHDSTPQTSEILEEDCVDCPEQKMAHKDLSENTRQDVSLSFIKEKRDAALLNLKKLVEQRNQAVNTLEKINAIIGKQKSYIEAWNDLLPDELRNSLPEGFQD